ncbi:hypothetical protein EON76_04580 [bacterium]|nr:MAG: hypothetical protein EON76_04580 [bacterium]
MSKVANSKLTLGLSMIMKDEIDDLDRIISDYGSLFDIYTSPLRIREHTQFYQNDSQISLM